MFFFMILDTINSLVLEGWDCLLCTKILLTKLFHISVCDVLPHLLASNNLKVDVTKQNGKDCDSQDDEVCIVYFQYCVGFFKSYSIKTLVQCWGKSSCQQGSLWRISGGYARIAIKIMSGDFAVRYKIKKRENEKNV